MTGTNNNQTVPINALLIDRAGRGSRVVRLKGGDPFIFGRGGEEASALSNAGIPFEVVPGVTSAIAAPAYAGIPLTHRGVSSSVTIATGSRAPNTDGGVDWRSLAAAGLARLGRLREATELFPTERFTPDVGQGILAAQFRAADADAAELLSPIVDHATSVAFRAERAFLEAFGGGCASPLAAYASVHNATLRISAMAAPNAGDIIRTNADGDVRHPDSVGRSAAQALLDAGAA